MNLFSPHVRNTVASDEFLPQWERLREANLRNGDRMMSGDRLRPLVGPTMHGGMEGFTSTTDPNYLRIQAKKNPKIPPHGKDGIRHYEAMQSLLEARRNGNAEMIQYWEFVLQAHQ